MGILPTVVPVTIQATGVAASLLVACVAGMAFGQDAPAPPPQQDTEKRSTGLPQRVSWTFNFDAGVGSFSFFNSLFTNPRDEPSGDSQ